MAVTTPCQDLRLVQHHDPCPLCTVQEFPCNLLPSDDPSAGKQSTNNRTWSDSRQTSMLCTNTCQQTPWTPLQARWGAVCPLILLDCDTILSTEKFAWWEEGGWCTKTDSQIYMCLIHTIQQEVQRTKQMTAVNKKLQRCQAHKHLTAFQANFNFSFFTLAKPMHFGMTVMYACDRLNKWWCE